MMELVDENMIDWFPVNRAIGYKSEVMSEEEKILGLLKEI